VISSATAERLSDVATLVPVGALELKGKTALVEAYELVDLVSDTTAAADTRSEAANAPPPLAAAP
jgi:class 3 adenylate cyclase